MSEQELTAIIAENIKTILEEKGMDQKDLAEAIGVSTSSVSRWISGEKMPRQGNIDAICKALKCTRNDILLKHSTNEVERLAEELKSREEFQKLLAAVKDLPADKLRFLIDMANVLIYQQEKKE